MKQTSEKQPATATDGGEAPKKSAILESDQPQLLSALTFLSPYVTVQR